MNVKLINHKDLKRTAVMCHQSNSVVIITKSSCNTLDSTITMSYDQIKKMADFIGYKGDK